MRARARNRVCIFLCFSLFPFLKLRILLLLLLYFISICLVFQLKAGIFIRLLSVFVLFVCLLVYSLECAEADTKYPTKQKTLTSNLTSSDNIDGNSVDNSSTGLKL